MKADAKPRQRGGSWKGEFYRQSRAWHGYLSAFAFLALIFFAVTGLLLNHPEWTQARGAPAERTSKVQLAPAEIARAQAAKDPARALAILVAGKTHLLGEFQSGEAADGEAQIRLEGVRGASDLMVDLESGKAEVAVTPARLVDTLNDLHRGKNAGGAWKAVIDISAVLIAALSLVGYVLFFSLRFRLRTSLLLTGASLAVLVGVVLAFTP